MHNRSRFLTLVVVAIPLCVGAFLIVETTHSSALETIPTSVSTLNVLEDLGGQWRLNEYGQVVWLNLKSLPLTDDDLSILRQLPHLEILNLRAIQVYKGDNFTDDGLKHLVGLRNLKTLDLSSNYRLTDACTKWLMRVPSLRKLNLMQTAITSDALPNLSHLIKLRELNVLYLRDHHHITLNEETVKSLRQMPLREILGLRIPHEAFPFMKQLKVLKKLPRNLYSKIRDDDLKHIRHLSQTGHLEVTLTRGWSDTSELKHLSALPNLEKLTLNAPWKPDVPVDRIGIRSLAKAPSLRTVYPYVVDDQVLEALSHCPQLTKIELASNKGNRLTPSGLNCLTRMANLKELTLPRRMVNDRTLEILSQIPSLERLGLDGRMLVNDYGGGFFGDQVEPLRFRVDTLKELIRLPHLNAIYLDGWAINDEALISLGKIDSLEILSLNSTVITNSGLMHLRRLSNLKNLHFYGAPIDIDVAIQLHKFIPECRIEDNWCCGCMTIDPVE